MNPLKWFRWKILAVLAVIFGGLYFLGLNPLAKREINNLGAGGDAGARFSVEQVAFGLLQGQTSFSAFQLSTPRKVPKEAEAAERVAQADQVVFDAGMGDLLSRRFSIDEVSVKRPVLSVERRADGTINIGDLGSKEPEAEKPAGKPTDWVKAVEEWMEKLRKRAEERRKKEAEKKERKEPEVAKKPGWGADYSRRITYPFERVPRVLVRKLSAEALEIQFNDQTGALKPPPIKNGRVTITNLSDRPEYVAEPINIEVAGEMEGATFLIKGILDLRSIAGGAEPVQKNDIRLEIVAKNVPLKTVVEAFAGDSLKANFENGTADLNAEMGLIDLEKISVRALAPDKPLFALRDVRMKAKPGEKIAGIPADDFCQAVNKLGKAEISKLEIGGTLSQPQFNWGDSVQELLRQAAMAAGNQAIEKGAEAAQKLLDKELKKNPEFEKLLKKNPELEKALPGGDVQKSIKDGAGKALQGLLGGKKQEPQKKEAEKKQP